jgi:glycosyltransferase involved in cell wall biosynthesis
MKIVHVLATADRTGAETAVYNLSRALKVQGAEVHVIFFGDGVVVEDFRAAGVPCEIVPVGGKTDVGAVFRLSEKLREFDVVHTHGARAMFIGNLAAKWARRPVVTTFHELSTAKVGTSRLTRLFVQIEGFLARFFTDQCIANSDATRNDAIQQRHVPADKITRIYNTIDVARFFVLEDRDTPRKELYFSKDDVMVGFVGRLSAVKGTNFAIEAMPRIREALPNAHLLIVGAGPMREELEALAKQLHVDDITHFLGTFRDLNPIYNALDVLVQPSLSEAFGLAALEAILCGVPVVVSEAGGLPEVAAFSPHGKVVPIGDSAKLADAVIEVVRAKPPRTPATGLEAQFSAEAVARQHTAIYQRCLKG